MDPTIVVEITKPDHQDAFVGIAPIDNDVPQHPALH